MEIISAMQLKDGKKVKTNKLGNLTQPIQFLPQKEKDDGWLAWNMDFFEMWGMRQIKRNASKLLKNYRLSKGIIERSDYIIDTDNELSDVIDLLTKEEDTALELKFYPIIPNVVNVLCNEFSTRSSKLMFRAVDDTSYSEMLAEKKDQIEQVLLQEASFKMAEKIQQMGLDPLSDDAKEMQSVDSLKRLPEIEEAFNKTYRNIYEEWATHQKNVDTERFKLQELEEIGFRDSLVADREFWHFSMYDDDYEVELWNPLLTFYNKSPETRYISGGNSVGKIEMMTISDVIDRYGWMMTEEQLESLENIYPIKAALYGIPGIQNDGSFYDPSRSHEWNTQMPSLAMRQFNTMYDGTIYGDTVDWILSDSEDFKDFNRTNLLRVSTIYWKTQRKFGHLTKITEQGEIIQDIVTEDYIITDKPIYNTTLYTQKTKDTLLFGEHIDWMWLNEVNGGVKIGPNRPASWNATTVEDGLSPMYLGLRGGKPGRIPFQFKGDNSLYGCKLPVEGCVYSDRNTKSVSLVDAMKPFQIAYNIVNNQIADILVDELGTVILLDQNALPRKSLGEDWGVGNYAKAFMAMKNFQILPLDTSLTNTENPLHFQHFQQLDLEQTNRLLSRVNLATYFKGQAFEVIGVNPQRLGQEIQQTTATGVEQAVQASYAQTEGYFTQHSDRLMPRVHQMRTDLAQWYNSTKPSIRLQYITTNDEKVNFQINGTKLLLRDINVFCVTNNNSRAIMEQLRSLALNNNTSGASIYDLGNILKADSIAEITSALKEAENKIMAQKQADQAHEQQLQSEMIATTEKQKQMDLEFEANQNQMDREKDITVAEIRSAGFGSTVDLNSNSQNDYLDALDRIQKQANYKDQMNFNREKEVNKQLTDQEKLALDREKLATQQKISQQQLQIAKENKNKYDSKSKK